MPKVQRRGRVYDMDGIVFTAGIGFLIQVITPETKDICPQCGGTGKVYYETIIENE